MSISIKKRSNCRLCSSKKLFKVVKLPKTIPGEHLFIKNQTNTIKLAGIDLYQCANCFHVQICDIPSPDLLWGKTYTFISSMNSEILEHFKKIAKYLKTKVKKINFAFEIGSNDGSFLKEIELIFKCNVLGIDPSIQPILIAKKNLIPTIKDYFNFNKSIQLKKKYGSPDLVIANNVFAHMDDLQDFTRGISNLLDNKGFFIFEISYLPDVLKKQLIGTIIHEHLSMHSVLSLQPFLSKYNLFLKYIKHVPSIQGGALIGIAQKLNKPIKHSKDVEKFMKYEKKINLNSLIGMGKFNDLLNKKLERLIKKITKIPIGYKYIGYGAARSAPLIIDLLKIRKKLLYIIDDHPFKKNKFLHKNFIPIVPLSKHKNNRYKNIYFILGWAQTSKIINTIKTFDKDCFVVTIYPEFELIKI